MVRNSSRRWLQSTPVTERPQYLARSYSVRYTDWPIELLPGQYSPGYTTDSLALKLKPSGTNRLSFIRVRRGLCGPDSNIDVIGQSVSKSPRTIHDEWLSAFPTSDYALCVGCSDSTVSDRSGALIETRYSALG